MSKFYVKHGSVELGTGKGEDAERKTYQQGESFDADDADVKNLLDAGTIGKGTKPADGEDNKPSDEEKRAAEAAAAREAAAKDAPAKPPPQGHR